MRKVFKVRRRGVLAVNVEPDEAFGVDGTTEYLCEVERINVGEAGADERSDGGVICGAEGASRVVRGRDVDGARVDERGMVD